MVITATEFKQNLGRYLDLAQDEDIYITRNGVEIAKVVSPVAERVAAVKSLFGILPSDTNLEKDKVDYLENKYGLE